MKNGSDIIVMELKNGEEIMEQYGEVKPFKEYSKVSDMTKRIKEETESLVEHQTIPKRDIIVEVSTAELAIDLAMANIAKQGAVKIQKLEGFLGKIEDKLFTDEILEDMSKGDLLLLYTNTRMMKSDAFRMIREIRKDVDFATLEANLLSLHAKESVKEASGDKMSSVLETLFSDDIFLQAAENKNREEMNKSTK